MHAVVMESLEDYLSGTLEPAVAKGIEAHLSTCKPCHDEVRSMQDVSQLFGSLQVEETLEASAGFYAGIVAQVEAQAQPAPPLGGLFALDFGFARRVAFASLMTLAILGTYLVTHEVESPASRWPEAVMAQQDSPAFESAPAPDNMLVTLTAYEER